MDRVGRSLPSPVGRSVEPAVGAGGGFRPLTVQPNTLDRATCARARTHAARGQSLEAFGRDTIPAVEDNERRYILTLSCPDTTGIVARISGFLADIGGWITEAAYHSDPESGRFFTRQEIRADSLSFGVDRTARAVLRDRRGACAPTMSGSATPRSARASSLLVSQAGSLPVRPAVPLALRGARAPTSVARDRQSRHPGAGRGDVRPAVPARPGADGRRRQGGGLRPRSPRRSTGLGPDAIVLARFMQVVPPELCAAWDGSTDQHPPRVPAVLPRRPAVPPGPRPRRQGHRRHLPLRDRRTRRRADHRAGRDRRRPHRLARRAWPGAVGTSSGRCWPGG